jgi:hypothetical protein
MHCDHVCTLGAENLSNYRNAKDHRADSLARVSIQSVTRKTKRQLLQTPNLVALGKKNKARAKS